MALHDVQPSADTVSMDKFIIGVLFVGSLLTPLAAARGMLGLLLHLMTLGRQDHRLQASGQHTPANL
jgi:hypothetical protein